MKSYSHLHFFLIGWATATLPSLAHTEPPSDPDLAGDRLTEIHQRLDEITHQLEHEAAELEWCVRLLRGPAQQDSREELLAMVDAANVSVGGIIAELNDLEDHLEALEEAAWDRRPAWHRVHGQVLASRDRLMLLRTTELYYRVVLQEGGEGGSDGQCESKQELRDVLQKLQRMAPVMSQELQRQIDVWLPRLLRAVCSGDEQRRSQMMAFFTQRIERASSPQQQWSWRSERVRLRTDTEKTSNGDKSAGSNDLAELNHWLSHHRGELQNESKLRWTATLIGVERRVKPLEQNPSCEQMIAVLGPLKRLIRTDAPAAERASLLLGRQLVDYLPEISGKKTIDFDDVEWVAVARYLQSGDMQSIRRSERPLSAFLESYPETSPFYPEMLARRALVYDLLTPVNLSYQAVEDRLMLARHFPSWRSSTRIPPLWSDVSETDAQMELKKAMHDLLGSYQSGTQRQRDLLFKALALLVGRIDQAESEPAGPFADSTLARQMRYRYGVMLLEEEAFAQAGRWFACVPLDDSHHLAAKVLMVRCEMELLRQNDGNNGDADKRFGELRRSLSKQLRELSQTHSDGPALLVTQLAYFARSCLNIDPVDATLCLSVLEEHAEIWDGDDTDTSLRSELWFSVSRAAEVKGNYDAALKALIQGCRLNTAGVDLGARLQRLVRLEREQLLDLHAQGARWSDKQHAFLALLEQARREFTGGIASIEPIDRALVEWRVYQLLHGQVDRSLKKVVEQAYRQRKGSVTESLEDSRLMALSAYALGDHNRAVVYWQSVLERASRTDPSTQYFWWEARYYGLLSSATLDTQLDLSHAAEVLLNTYPDDSTFWKHRLRDLVEQIPTHRPADEWAEG